MVGSHRCVGARGASAGHAAEMGIYIDQWTVDPKHRPDKSPKGAGRICHRPRVGPSPRTKPRCAIQELPVRLPPRLGRPPTRPTDPARLPQRVLPLSKGELKGVRRLSPVLHPMTSLYLSNWLNRKTACRLN